MKKPIQLMILLTLVVGCLLAIFTGKDIIEFFQTASKNTITIIIISFTYVFLLLLGGLILAGGWIRRELRKYDDWFKDF